MPTIAGPTSPTLPIEVTIVASSPHVVAYKLWWRDTTSDWTVIGEGATEEQSKDHYQRPFTKGAQLLYLLGIGGRPSSNFQVIVILSQDGEALPNGCVFVSGTTNTKGVGTWEDWASFA
jgi:hypothetical protein